MWKKHNGTVNLSPTIFLMDQYTVELGKYKAEGASKQIQPIQNLYYKG